MLAMEGCVPTLSKKLKDLGIRNFEELYRFRVQKESDLAQEKRFFGGRSGNKDGVSSSSNVHINTIRKSSSSVQVNTARQPSNSMQINVVRQP